MERKEMEDREQRDRPDSPEQAAAPVADDAARDETEGVLGSPWWESGSGDEEAAAEEPETSGSTGYIYRGVRYGEPVAGLEPEPTEEPSDDDDPVDLSVLAVMSEDQPGVPPAEGEEADEPVGAPWWQAGPRREEEAEEEPGAARDTEPPPEPEIRTREETADRIDPVNIPAPAIRPAVPPTEGEEADEPVGAPWWQTGPRREEEAGTEPGATGDTEETPLSVHDLSMGTEYGEPPSEPEAPAPEEPDDDPVDLSTPAAMSEAQPAIPAAEAHEADEPVIGAPWWPAATELEEESLSEPEAPAPQEPGHVEDPVDLPTPATMSAGQPAVLPAEGEELPVADAPEDPADHHRLPPGSPAGLPGDTEALPERPPAELIRSIVVEACPDELLLVEAAAAPLPQWTRAAVTAARNDLDRRSGERKPIDAGEYLRLAIVENAVGLHDEADAHLKEALPRSDEFGPVLNALAVTSLARGKIAPAIVYCKEALRETGGDDSVRAAASSNLGTLYELQGDAAQAAEAYETAIQCLQAREDPRWLSRLHLCAGRLYRRLGQADKARLHLSDSVRLSNDSGDQAGQVQSLAALGSALTESGLHDLALRSLEEAVRICLRTGDKPGAALVQDELGVAYMAQDQLTRSLPYLESALSLHRELGNRKAEAATLSNMAKIYESRGDTGEARQLYESALDIDPAVGHTGRPRPASGDRQGASAKLLQAEEILSRAESAEHQEFVRRTIDKPGPGTEGLG